MSARVSMLVPCRDGSAYLRPFLRCVAAQTWHPLELVFVDDGSADDTCEVFHEMQPELERAGIDTVLLSIPKGGQAAAINAGLSVFSGEYLTWADSDDLLCPESVRAKAAFLDKCPEYGMVRHDAWNYDQNSGVLTQRACRPEHRGMENIFDALFRGTTYCYAGCYMIRASLFRECFPEQRIPLSPEGQNLQLLLPPASRTRCGFISAPLMIYRMHSESHAHRTRDHGEQLVREDGFRRLRHELLPYCTCDRAEYARLADEMFVKIKRGVIADAAAKYRQASRKGEQ